MFSHLPERVKKVDTLSRDKRNHSGKALFCVFPPIPPFQSKTGSAEGFASAHRRLSRKESLRRRMSACVTIFLPFFRQTGLSVSKKSTRSIFYSLYFLLCSGNYDFRQAIPFIMISSANCAISSAEAVIPSDSHNRSSPTQPELAKA